MTINALLREASKLTAAERGELLDALLLLDAADGPVADLTPAQQEDLDRRIEEYRAGKAKMIPGDEAIAMLRKRG
jgi:putative addiction module component (TIGR02574 family)